MSYSVPKNPHPKAPTTSHKKWLIFCTKVSIINIVLLMPEVFFGFYYIFTRRMTMGEGYTRLVLDTIWVVLMVFVPLFVVVGIKRHVPALFLWLALILLFVTGILAWNETTIIYEIEELVGYRL